MDPTVAAAALGVGGTVIVAVAGLWASVWSTRKTVALTTQGQVADRFTKAIDQLGSDKPDVRIGGIYALERVARDSRQDHYPAVMDVLTTFVRVHSHEPRPSPATSGMRSTLPDVQAAIRSIGRLQDGRELNLAGADLTDAILDYADLSNAWLQEAIFSNASAHDAKFIKARLQKADFTKANLTNTDFTNADLTDAIWPEYPDAPKGWIRDTDSGRLGRPKQDAAAPRN
jgi:Pentapeptide repeats (9 copies)